MKKVIIDGNRIKRAKFLSKDKDEAKKIVMTKIQDLIVKHYDNYRYEPTELDNDYICCMFNRENKDLMGMMMLLKSEINGCRIGEVGVSLVAKEYRGLGVQSKTASDVAAESLTYLRAGNPLYATTRSFTSQSQNVMDRVKLPEKNGIYMRVGKARGMAPYYLFSKENDKFFIEMHMLFESWLPINKLVERNIYLPPVARALDFCIFNKSFRRDIDAIYQYPIFDENGKLSFEEVRGTPKHSLIQDCLDNDSLYCAEDCSIINHEGPSLWKQSRYADYMYTDGLSADSDHRVVYVEKIADCSFLERIEKDESIKSVNVTVQISDFNDNRVKAANLMLIQRLLLCGFVPAAVYDVLKGGLRIRAALFSKWQYIPVQAKFEFLDYNRKTFEIFVEDCAKQGYVWPYVVNYVDSCEVKKNEDARSTKLQFLSSFEAVPKSAIISRMAPDMGFVDGIRKKNT